jgi:cell shape-determining protein MreD
MNRFLLPFIFIFLKFAFVQLFSLPWPLFEPVLALAVIYTFFHSLDTKGWLIYAFFCGFVMDIFGFDVFGLYMFSCILSCFAVSVLTRFIYRQNWVFIFPMIFVGIFLTNHFVLFFKTVFLSQGFWISQYGWVLARIFLEAAGTTLLAYPFYHFSKRCAPELIG